MNYIQYELHCDCVFIVHRYVILFPFVYCSRETTFTCQDFGVNLALRLTSNNLIDVSFEDKHMFELHKQPSYGDLLSANHFCTLS